MVEDRGMRSDSKLANLANTEQHRHVKAKIGSVLFIFVFGFSRLVQACINDSKTLWIEKRQQPTLAQTILSPKIEKPNVKALTEDILKLKTDPKTNDVAWWNELAGAYLRLGQPKEAAQLLEPVTNRFSNDYGIHANLGTAYHLLGRYAEAEKEIRRDLEINPDGHFGYEKYHLALLQYLGRDEEYRSRHVFVEEFTGPFLNGQLMFVRPLPQSMLAGQHEYSTNNEDKVEETKRKKLEEKVRRIFQNKTDSELSSEDRSALSSLAMRDDVPEYVEKWDLGKDSKLDDGVMYMASLNPKEPACKVMLGMIALRHSDIHLAKAAFEQAIQLGSPQEPILRAEIIRINQRPSSFFNIPIFVLGLIGLVIAYYLFCKWREFNAGRRKRAQT